MFASELIFSTPLYFIEVSLENSQQKPPGSNVKHMLISILSIICIINDDKVKWTKIAITFYLRS